MLRVAAINGGGLCRLYGSGTAKRDAVHVIGVKKAYMLLWRVSKEEHAL